VVIRMEAGRRLSSQPLSLASLITSCFFRTRFTRRNDQQSYEQRTSHWSTQTLCSFMAPGTALAP